MIVKRNKIKLRVGTVSEAWCETVHACIAVSVALAPARKKLLVPVDFVHSLFGGERRGGWLPICTPTVPNDVEFARDPASPVAPT